MHELFLLLEGCRKQPGYLLLFLEVAHLPSHQDPGWLMAYSVPESKLLDNWTLGDFASIWSLQPHIFLSHVLHLVPILHQKFLPDDSGHVEPFFSAAGFRSQIVPQMGGK